MDETSPAFERAVEAFSPGPKDRGAAEERVRSLVSWLQNQIKLLPNTPRRVGRPPVYRRDSLIAACAQALADAGIPPMQAQPMDDGDTLPGTGNVLDLVEGVFALATGTLPSPHLRRKVDCILVAMRDIKRAEFILGSKREEWVNGQSEEDRKQLERIWKVRTHGRIRDAKLREQVEGILAGTPRVRN
jgi:hypothetical protein